MPKAQILNNILDAIGETPLVRLPADFAPEVKCEILLKLEYQNPGGSVKDRIALQMIRAAEESGELTRGGTIVECTSGNTGAGLCMVAAALGYKSIIVIPDKMSQEKIDTLRAYGAKVVVTPANAPAGDPLHYTKVAERIAKETPNSWWANQFGNQQNPEAHYQSTGPEIWRQCGEQVDVFVAGCGTGGTISGTAKYLKEQNPSVKIVGVDPPGSVYAGYWKTRELPSAGSYAVEGVGEDEIPGTWDPELIDDYQVISDSDSFKMTRELCRLTGIFAGGSSGMALCAALNEAKDLPAGAKVVVLIPDSGRAYLSKVFSNDWLMDNNFKPGISAESASISDLVRDKANATVNPDDTLAWAFKQISDRAVRPLAVINPSDQSLMGFVDEQQLMFLLAADDDLSKRQVRDYISNDAPVVSIDANTPWQQALSILSNQEAVLVKTDAGWTSLSRHDLLRALPRLTH